MSWLRSRRERPDAVARLCCLPFAGGTALAYRSWIALAPPEIESCPVQLPGHDDRAGDPPFVRMSALVAALAEAIAPLGDLPFAIFGLSMGARVDFERVRHLRNQGGPSPIDLFASGSRAPHVPSGGPDLHRLSDADLIGELRRMRGTPDDLLADAAIVRSLAAVPA